MMFDTGLSPDMLFAVEKVLTGQWEYFHHDTAGSPFPDTRTEAVTFL